MSNLADDLRRMIDEGILTPIKRDRETDKLKAPAKAWRALIRVTSGLSHLDKCQLCGGNHAASLDEWLCCPIYPSAEMAEQDVVTKATAEGRADIQFIRAIPVDAA